MTFSQRRFRQHRVGFVSPKCGLGSFRQNLPLSPVRAQVARVIANNRPDTMERSRRPFLAAAGWFFPVASSAKTPLASFRQNAPRPHAEEHRSAKQVGCFPSSAALRCVSKHEGHAAAVFILRDARALVRLCESACACALLRMRTAEPAARRRSVGGHFHLTISNSPSRSRGAFLRPGFATLLHSPRMRGGRSAEKRSGARRNTRGVRHSASKTRERAYDAAYQALARRLASHDAGRSPLGAPPWRF